MQLSEQPATHTDLAVVGRVAQRELQELMRQRSQLNRRISVLRRTVRAVLGGDEARDTSAFAAVRLTPRKRDGITHACRTALSQMTMPLTAREITELVRSTSPEALAGHREPQAAVTAVLRYLLESGETNNGFDDEGRRTWFATRSRTTT